MSSIAVGQICGWTGDVTRHVRANCWSFCRQCFAYDGLRRLTNAWTPSSGDCATSNRTVAGLGGADPYWTSYSYDAVGNRTGVTQHATAADGGNQSSTYTYPTAGGAAGSKPHAVTRVTTKDAGGATTGTSSFSYDHAGNMTGRTLAGQAKQMLSWDAEGELASLSQDGNGDGDATDAGEKDGYLYSADGEAGAVAGWCLDVVSAGWDGADCV